MCFLCCFTMFQAYASEVVSEEYNALSLSVVRLLSTFYFISSLLPMFTSSWGEIVPFHFFQVSTSRGIGLILGPAIGGYLAQVRMTLESDLVAYIPFLLGLTWLLFHVLLACRKVPKYIFPEFSFWEVVYYYLAPSIFKC